jgi:hypothetical protein
MMTVLFTACSTTSAVTDGGADLSMIDQAIDLSANDQAIDLSIVDHGFVDLAGVDLAGSVTLLEGPCPASLNNGRCYYPPGVDLGFF